jgi:hypothetical protein
VDNFESHAKVFRIFALDDPRLLEEVGAIVKKYLE